MVYGLLLVTTLLVAVLGGRVYDHGVYLDTHRPLIIAHRGSSGALPEHTLEAYRLAIEQGADVIECDVCVTKDLRLICRHESWLNMTTNVMDDASLRQKTTTYYIDSYYGNVTDVFSVDLTLAEIQSLRVKQPLNFRNEDYNSLYKIPTFEEYIAVAKSAGRSIGLYPEVKNTDWVNSLDIMKNAKKTIEQLVVEVLQREGYRSKTDPCFLQSFEEKAIRELSKITELPLVYLMWFGDRTDEEYLKDLAEICYGIGPPKGMIIPETDRYLQKPTRLVETAHKVGLKVHPYTFRNEDQYLAWNYTGDYIAEYQRFYDLGIDGYFTDFPASLHRFLDSTYSSQCTNAAHTSSVIPTWFLLWFALINMFFF